MIAEFEAVSYEKLPSKNNIWAAMYRTNWVDQRQEVKDHLVSKSLEKN